MGRLNTMTAASYDVANRLLSIAGELVEGDSEDVGDLHYGRLTEAWLRRTEFQRW